MPTFNQMEQWCSPARMAVFLGAADGNQKLATDLHEWNAALSGAFLEVMHRSEIVFRNHVHATLATAYPANPDPWYFNRSVLLARGVEDAEAAADRLSKHKREPTEDRIIAALSFGFWSDLFLRKYQPLWDRCLHPAFFNEEEDGHKRRGEVAAVTSKVRLFRNRVAHHEVLLFLDLEQRHNEILDLARLVAPEAGEWVTNRSRVPGLLASRPA